MSKWVNKDKFEEFKQERENDKSADKNNVDFARVYPNPKMGTFDKPKEYHSRLLTDPDGNFYKKYYYHMFQSGENWNFIMCPKTHDMNEYCPWCHATQLLYKGSASDKKKAYQYKRKEKYVGNIYVIRDPRDVDEQDNDKKFANKTFLYNFPQTIETLIRKEITDTENGWGYDIFDPQNGHNLIISIGAKKPDKNGKVWPDYSLTTFAKRSSSIAKTESEIEEIMNTCQSIDDYINNSMMDVDENKDLLKSEMLYDDVEEQFLKFMKVSNKEEETEKVEVQQTNEQYNSSNEQYNSSNEQSNMSDDDLLAELDSM